MSTIVKPFTFSAGATIIAAEHNSNFDTIYNDYNGGITNTNIAGGAAIANSKINLQTISQSVAFTGNIKLTPNDTSGAVFISSGTSITLAAGGTSNTYLASGTSGNPADTHFSKIDLVNGVMGILQPVNGGGKAPTVMVADGTYTTPTWASAVILTMVAGGGGGGGDGLGGPGGGGGGGGGAVYNHYYAVSPATGYPVKVGTGGAAGAFGNPDGTAGGAGGRSSFNSVVYVTGGSGGLGGNGGLGTGGNGGGAMISFNASGTSGGGLGFNWIKGGNGGLGIANRGGGGGGGIYAIGGQGGITGAQNSSTGTGAGAGGGGCDSDNPQSSNDASPGNDGIVIITAVST